MQIVFGNGGKHTNEKTEENTLVVKKIWYAFTERNDGGVAKCNVKMYDNDLVKLPSLGQCYMDERGAPGRCSATQDKLRLALCRVCSCTVQYCTVGGTIFFTGAVRRHLCSIAVIATCRNRVQPSASDFDTITQIHGSAVSAVCSPFIHWLTMEELSLNSGLADHRRRRSTEACYGMVVIRRPK